MHQFWKSDTKHQLSVQASEWGQAGMTIIPWTSSPEWHSVEDGNTESYQTPSWKSEKLVFHTDVPEKTFFFSCQNKIGHLTHQKAAVVQDVWNMPAPSGSRCRRQKAKEQDAPAAWSLIRSSPLPLPIIHTKRWCANIFTSDLQVINKHALKRKEIKGMFYLENYLPVMSLKASLDHKKIRIEILMPLRLGKLVSGS